MNYRLTCLTPTLIGDGSRLSPIDYMVWKDQVNVLDQGRIFRLLSKGPRLDSYLKQIKRADKLDFSSWGGFAQNFALRRIPFEHNAYAKYWEQLGPEHLHIPTFVTSTNGPFLPGSALKGALRTALVHSRAGKGLLKDVASRSTKDRPLRRPGESVEERSIGSPGQDRLKVIAPADSGPIPHSALKIYLLRTATIQGTRPDRLEPRWKISPSGSVEAAKPQKSTPVFVEMAVPGTVFEGVWGERPFYRSAAVVKSLRWKSPLSTTDLIATANDYAAAVLAMHIHYARWTRLSGVETSMMKIQETLNEVQTRHDACLLPIGWGGGFLTKAALLSTADETYRDILRQYSFYAKAIRTGLPFPKTRRVVFLEDRPATLPGWVMLEIVGLPKPPPPPPKPPPAPKPEPEAAPEPERETPVQEAAAEPEDTASAAEETTTTKVAQRPDPEPESIAAEAAPELAPESSPERIEMPTVAAQEPEPSEPQPAGSDPAQLEDTPSPETANDLSQPADRADGEKPQGPPDS